jgi:hypothetical protein
MGDVLALSLDVPPNFRYKTGPKVGPKVGPERTVGRFRQHDRLGLPEVGPRDCWKVGPA